MNWQQLTGLILGVLIFGTICFLLGRSSKMPDPPKTITNTTIVHDTIQGKPKPPIIIHDTTYATRDQKTITDSISGTKQGASYKIKHTISEIDKDLKKYPSDWEVNIIPPPLKIVKEYITKDSVQTITATEYISKPFFLNEWFYVSIIELTITILAIIF